MDKDKESIMSNHIININERKNIYLTGIKKINSSE